MVRENSQPCILKICSCDIDCKVVVVFNMTNSKPNSSQGRIDVKPKNPVLDFALLRNRCQRILFQDEEGGGLKSDSLAQSSDQGVWTL